MRIGFAALAVQGLYGVSCPSGNGTERETESTPAKGVEGKPFCKGTARFGGALFPMRVEQQPIILLSNIDTSHWAWIPLAVLQTPAREF